MATLRYAVAKHNDAVYCESEETLRSMGMADDAVLASVFPGFEWCELELKPATFGLHQQAERGAIVPDFSTPNASFIRDDNELLASRAEAYVARWTFKNGDGNIAPVTKDGYKQLPNSVAFKIDAAIQAHAYPTLRQVPDFLSVLSDRLKQQSEEKKPE